MRCRKSSIKREIYIINDYTFKKNRNKQDKFLLKIKNRMSSQRLAEEICISQGNKYKRKEKRKIKPRVGF